MAPRQREHFLRYWPFERENHRWHKRPVTLSLVVFSNTLRLRQTGHFADDIFKCLFLNEKSSISINISLKFVPEGRINNIPALVQIMAWRRLGDKPLSEPMMVSSLTHICVTRPQWVNVRHDKWLEAWRGESTGNRWFPLTKVTQSLDIFFDVGKNKWLDKQLCCRWFDKPGRHCDDDTCS